MKLDIREFTGYNIINSDIREFTGYNIINSDENLMLINFISLMVN